MYYMCILKFLIAQGDSSVQKTTSPILKNGSPGCSAMLITHPSCEIVIVALYQFQYCFKLIKTNDKNNNLKKNQNKADTQSKSKTERSTVLTESFSVIQ